MTGDRYPQAGNRVFAEQMTLRSASRQAAFFLPFLRPGMRLLDVGCGPGSITVGLAEVVAPGEVVGIDIDEQALELARRTAQSQGAPNVRFERADIHALDFADASFDAAFAHASMFHVHDPVTALIQVRRVLRPGGFVGIRDVYLPGAIRAPSTPVLDRVYELGMRARSQAGSNSYFGPVQRQTLVAAGFSRTVASASAESAGGLEETRQSATFAKAQILGFGRIALAEGWLTQSELDSMSTELESWAERPDAYSATLFCEVIGWV